MWWLYCYYSIGFLCSSDFNFLHCSTPSQIGENSPTGSALKSNTTANEHMDVEPSDVLTLAKNALSASLEAASLAETSKSISAGLNESTSLGSVLWC